MKNNIKAILFDSGKVLNEPVSGHWFITLNFFNHLDKKIFELIPEKRLDDAFRSASEYISKQRLIETESDECKHFFEFYKLFFSQLPELKTSEYKIKEVAMDLVYNYDKYVFYQDVLEHIPLLSTKYSLAIVSDAWPSLENVYKKAGLRDYFTSFVISSKLGTLKPDKLMYQTALDELKVSVSEAVFVDDSIKNCDGAKALGIKTFLLCRNVELYIINKVSCKDHIVIRNLGEIEKFIE